MIGQRFGRLLVIAKEAHPRKWQCQCDCGQVSVAYRGNLLSGNTRSCGCLRHDWPTKHGQYASVEYRAWRHIVERCTNPNDPRWKHYGGRGITICGEWRHDFAPFAAHVGSRPSAKHSIDRIDNSRGYEPGNVRWATRQEQMRNTRATRMVEIDGKRVALITIADRAGVSAKVAKRRLDRGWLPGPELMVSSHAE